ncbi:Oidioi.mRNA.OKI2018_I69.chr2.g6870.t1.cds [Oikopleura dioica]|uniref:Oidioi.mRNA.OKI2018_I69.chr2.g6870.t1.cds n=1 Tax=Oikopleura dioica TaxID=34765 RepID=A0ABN7TAI3_OIKDI|nr:Oidioi.mRNA.OKI2018_I69.chr2.g6870.t1.cds [Oikopleura dioica]
MKFSFFLALAGVFAVPLNTGSTENLDIRTRTGYNGAGKITITVNKVDWVREWGSLGQLPRDEIQTKLDELELSKAGFDENGLWSNDLTNENEKPAPLKRGYWRETEYQRTRSTWQRGISQ